MASKVFSTALPSAFSTMPSPPRLSRRPSKEEEEAPPNLVELSSDVLAIITSLLFDALVPHHLSRLAETCTVMRAALADGLAALCPDHKLARALCQHCSMPISLIVNAGRTPVEQLYWDNKGLGAAHGLPLYLVLRSEALYSLEQLYLHSNRLGRQGAAAIAGAIAAGGMPHLKHLYLFRNGIGDEGLQALSSAFANGVMRELETLGLRDNGIGDAGVSALANAFHAGGLPVFRALGLEENGISEVGVDALMGCARHHRLTHLEKLHLSSNLVVAEADGCGGADRGVAAIVSAIRDGCLPCLQRLTVSGSTVDAQLHRVCYERRISLAVGVGGMVFQATV